MLLFIGLILFGLGLAMSLITVSGYIPPRRITLVGLTELLSSRVLCPHFTTGLPIYTIGLMLIGAAFIPRVEVKNAEIALPIILFYSGTMGALSVPLTRIVVCVLSCQFQGEYLIVMVITSIPVILAVLMMIRQIFLSKTSWTVIRVAGLLLSLLGTLTLNASRVSSRLGLLDIEVGVALLVSGFMIFGGGMLGAKHRKTLEQIEPLRISRSRRLLALGAVVVILGLIVVYHGILASVDYSPVPSTQTRAANLHNGIKITLRLGQYTHIDLSPERDGVVAGEFSANDYFAFYIFTEEQYQKTRTSDGWIFNGTALGGAIEVKNCVKDGIFEFYAQKDVEYSLVFFCRYGNLVNITVKGGYPQESAKYSPLVYLGVTGVLAGFGIIAKYFRKSG